MTGLGVGPRVVDEMDLREVNDLLAYWSEYAPPHIASYRVALCMGWKPPEPVRVITAEEFASSFGLKGNP